MEGFLGGTLVCWVKKISQGWMVRKEGDEGIKAKKGERKDKRKERMKKGPT